MIPNLQKHPDVNRVQIISNSDGEIIWEECSNVHVSFQNDGKTLKVYLEKRS
jgi:hypothetical protein